MISQKRQFLAKKSHDLNRCLVKFLKSHNQKFIHADRVYDFNSIETSNEERKKKTILVFQS